MLHEDLGGECGSAVGPPSDVLLSFPSPSPFHPAPLSLVRLHLSFVLAHICDDLKYLLLLSAL